MTEEALKTDGVRRLNETASVGIEEEDEGSKHRKMLLSWFAIEGLMFFANIISNMIYVFTYSCSKKNRIRLINKNENSNTDMLSEHQVLISLVSSYFSPTIVTLCLAIFGLEAYPGLSNEVWARIFV